MADETLKDGLSLQSQQQQQLPHSVNGQDIDSITTNMNGESFDVNNPVHLSNLLFRVNFIQDIGFYVLLIAMVVFVWIRPSSLARPDFYRKCFSTLRKGVDGCGYFGPPRPWVFIIIWYMINTLITASGVYYAWNFRFPVTTTDTNYYMSIIYIFFGFCCLKYIWAELFWNFHQYKIAFGFSVLVCLTLAGIAFVLTVLYGIQHAIAPAVMFAIVTLWLLIASAWSAYIFYCYCTKPDLRCECHSQSHTYGVIHKVQYTDVQMKNVTVTDAIVNTQRGGGNHYAPQQHHQQHHQHHHKGHHNQHGQNVVYIDNQQDMGNNKLQQQQQQSLF